MLNWQDPAGAPLYRPPKIKQEIIYKKYIHKLSTPSSPKYAQCFPYIMHSKPSVGGKTQVRDPPPIIFPHFSHIPFCQCLCIYAIKNF